MKAGFLKLEEVEMSDLGISLLKESGVLTLRDLCSKTELEVFEIFCKEDYITAELLLLEVQQVLADFGLVLNIEKK
jgi:hypothetical protein